MTQPTNTGSTYKYSTIREDLEDFVYKISPTETPLMQLAGRKGEFENTYHEWPVVELATANDTNTEIEGGDVPNDAPTLATRFGNYAQLSDKVAQVSSTNEAVRGAGNVQRMAKQVLYKTQEIKRDIEARITSNKAAVAGDDSTARQTAGLGAFIRTNTSRGSGGTSATLSGTTSGYPNAAPGAGTGRSLTEAMVKTVIQNAWTQGGDPRYLLTDAPQKVNISAFTGNATRYKKAEDKRLVAAIDVYESDFGEHQVVPDRFTVAGQIYAIDPSMVEIGWLQPMRNAPLAKTGHSERRMVFCEFGLIVGNQKAHGVVADLS